MRNLRRCVRCCLLALALSAASGRSQAQLWIVAPDEEPQSIEHAELAFAHGDGPAATWLSLRFTPGPVAIVAALPKSAAVEHGLDAWFSALEAGASLNVLPPESAAACGKTLGYSHVGWPREAGVAPSELELRTAADVAAALEEQGLPAPHDLPEADHYAVWSWPRTELAATTRTLRVVGEGALLALSPGASFPLLVSGFSRGPVSAPSELPSDELRLTFVAERDNDYRDRLHQWLDTRREPLLEARLRGPLFDWSILADTFSLPPLVNSYARAAARELPDLDAEACERQLSDLRRADAPSAAACAEASDVALALAGAGPAQATLQRWATSGSLGFSPEELQAGGAPRSPLLRARSFEGPACVQDPPPVVVLDPAPSSGGPAPSQGTTTTVVVEETVVVDATPSHEIDCGSSPGRDPYDDRDSVDCGSDTSSEQGDDETCASDSSSSSRDEGCGSDSSSSSRDDGCGSDSSSSSRDEGCGSDSSSSSSSSDDTSCDGGTEDDSYDGDTCTGSAAPADRSRKAEASLRSPRRMKTSLWTLTALAVALPIRRRKRGQSRAG
jgi:hypothetical protein